MVKVNELSKQTLELYFGKGLSLYGILGKVNDELSRINFISKHRDLFESDKDYKDYNKYSKTRKITLRGMIILINKEIGYKNKEQRDKILEKHHQKLKKIRGRLRASKSS